MGAPDRGSYTTKSSSASSSRNSIDAPDANLAVSLWKAAFYGAHPKNNLKTTITHFRIECRRRRKLGAGSRGTPPWTAGFFWTREPDTIAALCRDPLGYPVRPSRGPI